MCLLMGFSGGNTTWHQQCQSPSWLLTIIMKSISAAQRSSVVSLLNDGYSHREIQARTGLGKGTVGRISKEVERNKENNPGDHPSKLSAHDKQSIVRQISFGKLNNAVQATQFIDSIIPNPVTPVRNTLRSQDFTLQQRGKSLCSSSLIIRGGSKLPVFIKTGLWRTGKGHYSQMRLRSIVLGLMGWCMFGSNEENHYQTEPQHQLSNMEGVTISWYGVVWGGVAYRSSGKDGCRAILWNFG